MGESLFLNGAPSSPFSGLLLFVVCAYMYMYCVSVGFYYGDSTCGHVSWGMTSPWLLILFVSMCTKTCLQV